MHVHWQSGSNPVTFAARPLQSLALLHVRRQSGYAPPYVGALHPRQSFACEKFAAHVWQNVPVQELLHEQLQFGTSPDTAVAWSLQSVMLHSRVQVGYPLYPSMQRSHPSEVLLRSGSRVLLKSAGQKLQFEPLHCS